MASPSSTSSPSTMLLSSVLTCMSALELNDADNAPLFDQYFPGVAVEYKADIPPGLSSKKFVLLEKEEKKSLLKILHRILQTHFPEYYSKHFQAENGEG